LVEEIHFWRGVCVFGYICKSFDSVSFEPKTRFTGTSLDELGILSENQADQISRIFEKERAEKNT
jgi:hypothetical protein